MRLLILLLFVCSATYAQDRNTVYTLTKTLSFDEYDFSNDPPTKNGKSEIVQKGTCFKIDHSDLTGHFITFLKWEGKDNPKNKIHANTAIVAMAQVDGTTKNVKEEKVRFYKISNANFKDHAELYINKNPKFSFVTGAITIPIKIRPGGDKLDANGNKIRPFDFTGDVNIGLSVGLRIRLDKKGKGFIIPAIGVNLTSVSIDESTVRNGIITSKTNASSLTPFLGVIGEYENFQVALITGWDRLSGKTGENWIYQGKPWFGIGLGYLIFNTSSNNPSNNPEDQP